MKKLTFSLIKTRNILNNWKSKSLSIYPKKYVWLIILVKLELLRFSKRVKMQGLQNQLNRVFWHIQIYSNWFHVKSKPQKICRVFTLCFERLLFPTYFSMTTMERKNIVIYGVVGRWRVVKCTTTDHLIFEKVQVWQDWCWLHCIPI